MADLLGDLVAIVETVGERLLDLRATAGRQGHWDGSQFKSEADRIAHADLTTRLLALAPDLPVISEEDANSHRRTRPPRYWLIDPIDGTASLAGGFEGFVTQVALMDGDGPLLAAVRAPALKLTYAARTGGGAFVNGLPLKMVPKRGLAVLIDNYPEPRGAALAAYRDLNLKGYEESGSIALKICRVADGTADLFFKDVVVRDWDIAPPHLVLREAGGHLSLPDGRAYPYSGDYEKPGVIATPTAAHTERVSAWLTTRSVPTERTKP